MKHREYGLINLWDEFIENTPIFEPQFGDFIEWLKVKLKREKDEEAKSTT